MTASTKPKPSIKRSVKIVLKWLIRSQMQISYTTNEEAGNSLVSKYLNLVGEWVHNLSTRAGVFACNQRGIIIYVWICFMVLRMVQFFSLRDHFPMGGNEKKLYNGLLPIPRSRDKSKIVCLYFITFSEELLASNWNSFSLFFHDSHESKFLFVSLYIRC